MYKTLVRPVVTYACETRVLEENIKSKLRLFKKKVLRRIYGTTKEKDGTWQIKSNEELKRLTGNKNITNYIKAQRLAWFGQVHRMPDNSMVKKVYEWSPALTRSLVRPKNRWEDDVKSDITRMKITYWNDCIRNRIQWKKLVEKAESSLKL
jgi:CRISPR/Cas system CSM-associated protein Csm2 small subunit